MSESVARRGSSRIARPACIRIPTDQVDRTAGRVERTSFDQNAIGQLSSITPQARNPPDPTTADDIEGGVKASDMVGTGVDETVGFDWRTRTIQPGIFWGR